MSMTEQEARSKCPMGQEKCNDCPRYADDCDGNEDMIKPMFTVMNNTDGITAAREPFDTREEAEKFCLEFRQRFYKQGYYFTSRMERISPDAIELEIVEM